MRRATLLAAALLALAAPGAAPAAPFEWADANDVVTSPDGRNVYAAGSSTLSFRADPDAGALELIGHTEPGAQRAEMAISPDGRFVYVGRGQNYPSGAIHVLSRDAESGLLTHEETFRGGDPANAAVGVIEDMLMSVDGRQLYVAARSPDLVAVYDRNAETGALGERQVLYGAGDLPVPYAMGLAGSPDGRHVYVAGGAIGILRREPATGLLTPAGRSEANGSHFEVAVAPDGGHVYGAGPDVGRWRRDATSGALDEHARAGLDQNCARCTQIRMISPAPDGGNVFAASPSEAALLQMGPASGGLSVQRRYADSEFRGIGYPNAMAWSADGRFAYLVGGRFTSPDPYDIHNGRFGQIATLRRTADGLDPVGSLGPTFDAEAPPTTFRRAAITINDGALYTNDPNVQVTVTNEPGAASLRLANGEDFAGARALRTGGRVEQTFPWVLAGSGPERSVKRVHVRFTPIDRREIRLFDDIILDQRPPELLGARIKGSRLLLKARDNRSGVRRVQVAASRRKPGKARRFRSSLPVARGARALHVRVFDGAGNGSSWRIARRP